MSESGKWAPVTDVLRDRGWSEDRLREEIGAGRILAKTSAGRELVFVEPEANSFEPAGPTGTESAVPTPEPPTAPASSALPTSALAETIPGEPLVTRLTPPQELALQTERALSLVERSMSAFMLMHQEVVAEKERSYENYKQALEARAGELQAKEEAVRELERVIRDKDQEIADLKMLVEILEGRGRKPPAPVSSTPAAPERASVGDLMEEQLRYIMEDSMVNELLK